MIMNVTFRAGLAICVLNWGPLHVFRYLHIIISSYQSPLHIVIFEFLLSVSLQCIAIGTCIVGRQAPRVLGNRNILRF